jgi:prolyl-tRNA editing enzyme YbaK/EbsC (Cys-tRNA(Pro) deacylase)
MSVMAVAIVPVDATLNLKSMAKAIGGKRGLEIELSAF